MFCYNARIPNPQDACALTTLPNPNPTQSPPAGSPPPPPSWRANATAALLSRLRDVLELLLLPAACAAVISAITWLIWYYMAVPCTLDFANIAYCYPTPAARFINLEIWGRCLTYGAIGAALGGGLNIVVFTRERNARRNVEYHYDRLTEWIIEDRERARQERESDREERQAQLQQQLQQDQEDRELRLRREQADREQQESDRQADREERARMLEMLTASHQQTMTLMGELIAELRDRRHNGNGSNAH